MNVFLCHWHVRAQAHDSLQDVTLQSGQMAFWMSGWGVGGEM